MVSLDITDQWYKAPGGHILAVSPTPTPMGVHSVLLVGYDDSGAEFKFMNSWGVAWGERGFGYIGYETFESTWWEGWLYDPLGDFAATTPEAGLQERSWGFAERGGSIDLIHGHEIVGPGEERIAWAFGFERGNFLEVEELFVRPQFRRKGYGRRLSRSLGNLATKQGKKLRMWISYADNAP